MIAINGTKLKFKTFSNGESFLDLDPTLIKNQNVITVKFESDADLIRLQFLKDELDDHAASAHLRIPYFPYCRMDRKEEDRLLTLRSVTKLINNMNFSSIEILEPHSDATPFGLSRAVVVNKSKELLMKLFCDITGKADSAEAIETAKEMGVVMVYPDAGAMKRYQKQVKYPYFIDCTKEREFVSGDLVGMRIYRDNAPNCKIAVIIDDLCSGGRTFAMVSEELRKQVPDIERVYLIVTHCENTIMEYDLLKSEILDGIYTTNSLLDQERFFEIESATVENSYIEDVYQEVN